MTQYVFLNYLRCHDDIGWGLDYDSLRRFGIEERPHKAYLNDFFRGLRGLSGSRGELYNEDPVTGDARLCGTTASLCGLQAALEAGTPEAVDLAIDAVVMLHAYMFMQSGIPVLYSGDEIGQLNDDSYHADPKATTPWAFAPAAISSIFTGDVSFTGTPASFASA